MKRFCVMFYMLAVVTMMGCSTFGSIKAEDIDKAELRLEQLTLVLGPNKDLDKAMALLDKAKLALAIEEKIKAEEYRDAALLIIDMLEK